VNLGPDRFGCIGSNITLNATFDAGVSYVWRDSLGNQIGSNPTYVVNQAGKYSVTITIPESGCSARDEIRIFSFEEPPATTNVIRVGDTLKIVNVVEGIKYQWRINGTISLGDTLTYLIIPSNAVSINLIYRNQFGCTRTTANLFTSVAGLLPDDGSIKIYPNPAKDKLQVDYEGSKGFLQLSIVDLKGSTIREELISSGEAVNKTMDISRLKSGLYLIKIQNGEKFRTAKLVVE
jgi:hypothetical protein